MENKIYIEKKEKIGDFLLGFIAGPLLIWLAGLIGYSLNHQLGWALGLVVLVGTICVGIKRKWIGIGLLTVYIIVPLVVVGGCLLVMTAGNLFR
jgi:hypothetical protein